MKMDMVAVDTLVPISNKTNTSFNDTNTMRFGVECYEAGMIHVLKGIAEEFLETAEIWSSDNTRKLNRIVCEMRYELEATFNPSLFQLIKKYEEALNEANSSDAGDFYMQGWLDGYRYLSNRTAYGCEGFFQRKNKCKENE